MEKRKEKERRKREGEGEKWKRKEREIDKREGKGSAGRAQAVAKEGQEQSLSKGWHFRRKKVGIRGERSRSKAPGQRVDGT